MDLHADVGDELVVESLALGSPPRKGEILEVLKRTYNRQRQAGITQEIAEIVGGAAALQG